MVHRTLHWLIAALVISAPAAGVSSARQGATAESAKRPRASLCGRVVTISCTSPQSDVGLTLSSPSGRPSWRLVIPSEYRSRFGARIEDLYDQRLVCVTAPAPLGDESVVVTGSDQVMVMDTAVPYPLPADVARTCDPDVRLPRVTRAVHAPMAAKISGRVTLRAVVERDGAVGDMLVVRSLEPTQNEEALKAVAQWQFEPATRGGQPVAMAITVEMAFTWR